MPYKDKERDRAHHRAYDRKWRAANRERLLEYARRHKREWRKANPERDAENQHRWYETHREYFREKHRQYRKQYPERIRAYERKYAAKRRERARLKVAKRWGDAEPRCRYDTLPSDHPLRNTPCFGPLEIDHMNGDGFEDPHRKRMYLGILNGKRGVDDLRMLCALHNLWNQF